MIHPYIIGQKVTWNSTNEEAMVYAWRTDAKGEIEIQVRPGGPFWSIWFFEVRSDGNDILKDLVEE